ncbi:transmembrane protein 72 isoform X2 [Protopterus annectens]|uniref:transmembrane protein 72 isoform X2 n=1 Tax=Protopterus annectens TaxID=7888 RepID=UPI001CF94FC2|nr:transmembrane protein 72 isoform X2 [Protopterus annectens]
MNIFSFQHILLIGVGIETILQGEFIALGVYLLCSSVTVSILELPYFIDLLLMPCLFCPPGSTSHIYWKKLARLGGFQKSLAYIVMSVACFLHPVLVWHVTIPGTMLIITGAAYFILSQRKKPKGGPDSYCLSENYMNSLTTMGTLYSRDQEQMYSTANAAKGRLHLLTPVQGTQTDSHGRAITANFSAAQCISNTKRVQFEEVAVRLIVSEMGSLNEESESEDMTSDTAPIISQKGNH